MISNKFYIFIGWVYSIISFIFFAISIVLTLTFLPEPSVNSSPWADIVQILCSLGAVGFWASQIYLGIRLGKNKSILGNKFERLGKLILIWTVSFAIIAITVLFTSASYMCTDCGPTDTTSGYIAIAVVTILMLTGTVTYTIQFLKNGKLEKYM